MPLQTDYQPIACDFHDLLESVAVRKTSCEIVFREKNGETRSVTTRILDVFSEGADEFAVLESGDKIRLDQLLSVGGTPRPQAC